MEKESLKGKKALVMGLGLHGGGVATTKWLVGQGAKVTATDMRTRKVLQPSIDALNEVKVRYVLGKHDEKDFATHDIIVANPGVPRESPFLTVAKKSGKRIVNDVTLFFDTATQPVIAVTGTRGKTTTTLWIANLLAKKWPLTRPSGNTPENALLKEITRIKGKDVPVVAELSSWQLEFLPQAKRAPHISVITNIYPDHLNRYGSIEHYAGAKGGIFANQTDGDFLILNAEDKWTPFFLKQKPRGMVFFTSRKELPARKNGIFVRDGFAIFRVDGIEQKLMRIDRFLLERGAHSLQNLLAALLAVRLFAPELRISEKDVLALKNPTMRQEEVFKDKRVTIVNDSCATSPDGVAAVLARFGKVPKEKLILITGGTDKQLHYEDLARALRNVLPKEQIVFLEGTGTTKLIDALKKVKFLKEDPVQYKTLLECVRKAWELTVGMPKGEKAVIVFSPGGSSFEKFLHEFARGAAFNELVKKFWK